MNIGFIGLGIMGAPMALHLANAGHALFVNAARTVPDGIKASSARLCPSAEQHRLYIRRIGHHHDHNISVARDLLRVHAQFGTECFDAVGHGSGRIDEQRVTGVRQVQCHRCAHDAETDKSNIDDVFS